MSLINDALKRADEQHKQSEASAPPPVEKPLQPVAHKSRAWVPVVLLMIVLLMVLALAAWFLSKWWEAQKHKAKKPVPKVAPAEIPKLKKPEVPIEPPPTPPKVVIAPSPPRVVKTNVTLKLQGVFIRTSKPSALINGKTVFTGDKIFDARVLSIEPDRVIVEEDGQTNQLTLK